MSSESSSQSRSPTISNDDARKLAVQDPALYNAGLDAVRGVTPEQLRIRFKEDRPWRHEMLGDGQFTGLELPLGHVYKRAAVLVPLVVRDSLTLLLTQRPLHLKHHPGQISFPGGRVEETDTDAIAAALRETEEEVGLPRQHVEVIGALPVYATVTGFEVTPVVALVRQGFELKLDALEVAEAFEVPLSFLMTPAHHRRHQFELAGQRRQFLSMPWQGPDVQGRPQNYFIWGATAAMLRNLYGFLAQS